MQKKRYTILVGTCSFLLGTKVAATRNKVAATATRVAATRNTESPLLGTNVAASRNMSRRYIEHESLLLGTPVSRKPDVHPMLSISSGVAEMSGYIFTEKEATELVEGWARRQECVEEL